MLSGLKGARLNHISQTESTWPLPSGLEMAMEDIHIAKFEAPYLLVLLMAGIYGCRRVVRSSVHHDDRLLTLFRLRRVPAAAQGPEGYSAGCSSGAAAGC